MARIKGGEKLKARLAELAKKVTNPGTLNVGFPEGATEDDGTSVPLLAAIHNYGAPANNIPPRPFFSNMIKDGKKHWGDDLEGMLKKNDWDATKALTLLGMQMEGELQAAIIDGNFVPLKPRTLKARGVSPNMKYNPEDPSTFGAKPLVRTGTMLRSVASWIR